MRKGMGLMFLVFAFAFALPFAAATDSNTTSSSAGVAATSTYAVSEAANSSASGGSSSGIAATTSSTYYALAGQDFKVVEYSNPSTGYNWAVAVDNPGVVSYVGYTSVDCQSQATSADGSIAAIAVGGGCNYAYQFKALAVGKATVTMKYMRSWDASSVAKVKQVVVVVAAANATSSGSNSTGGQTYEEYECTRKGGWWNKCASSCNGTNGTYCAQVCVAKCVYPNKVVPIAVNATSVPGATAVPVPTASLVSIEMRPGWNLFSVPSTYAGLYKTSCARERVYYYNAAAGQYVSSSFSSINGPKAHWFYSAESCSVVFSQKAAYANENYNEELKAGWNMMGAPVGNRVKAGKCEKVPSPDGGTTEMCSSYLAYEPVKLSDYRGNCNITVAYSFDTEANDWVKADALEAKKGYFVKVPAACRMHAPDETASIPALPE